MPKKKPKNADKPLAILVFGEDANDRESIIHLARAILPATAPPMLPRRKPLVLQKGRDPAEARKNALDVLNVVAADNVRSSVVAVLAHQDCDELEPAHKTLSRQIIESYSAAGVPFPCPATPAWETESWWYMWPEAVAEVNPRWKKLNRHGQEVGLIKDAKQQLIKDLRPRKGDKSTADYCESDSTLIAEKVRSGGYVHKRKAKSASFDLFHARLLELKKELKL